ncbi:MAG: hypothetical protein ACP5UQ_14595 [Anaerolineae bacterium]
MKRNWRSWPTRFVRWLCGSPFRRLPPAFGNPVPADLQVFEAQAEEATRRGLGGVAERPPVPHSKTKPARIDPALERQ